MNEMPFNQLIIEAVPNQKEANKLIAKLFDIAQPEAVYSQPIVAGDVTVITASEYMGGVGGGYGGGAGIVETDESGEESKGQPNGFGGGGGGGGSILSRPVAAIIIEPSGVRVEPIIDVTKISIAFCTAFGAMWLALSRMRRTRR